MMTAQEIIAYIGSAEKKTPVKVYINEMLQKYFIIICRNISKYR